MSPLVTWFAIPFCGCCAGILLFRLSRRGRQVNDHPICAACGYDLFTLTITAESACPECGTRLKSPRAIRIGRRESRRGLFWISCLLTSAAFVGLGIASWFSYRALQEEVYQPTWWLVRQVDSPSHTTRDNSLDELMRRLYLRKISAYEAQRVADRVLNLQADTTISWNRKWGEFIEVARWQSLIDDARWSRFAEQAMFLKIACRQKVRSGDQFQFEISTFCGRAGYSQYHLMRYGVSISLDKRPLKGPFGIPEIGDYTMLSSTIVDLRQFNPDVFDSLDYGHHVLDVTITGHPPGSRGNWDLPQLIATLPIHRSAQFTLVPATTSTVELVSDQSIQGKVSRGITALGFVRGIEHQKVQFQVRALPIDLAADVVIVGKDRRYSTTPLQVAAGRTGVFECIINETFPDDRFAPADVIVRDNINLASNTISVTRIWAGQLLFKNVHEIDSSSSNIPIPAIIEK